MKKRTLLTILQYVIFLGLGIIIIYRMIAGMSADEKSSMIDAIKQTRLWLLVPVAVAGFLSHFLRALRWKLLLKPLDIRPSTTNTVLSVLIGYVVNLLVPRMGEVAKCTVLARYESVPADKMVGTIVAERTFDVVSLAVITILTFLLQADIIGDYASSLLGQFAGKTTLFVGAITGLLFLILFMIFLYRRNKESKIARFIKGMADGVSAIWMMKDRGKFLLYTVLIWCLYWSQGMLGFWAMPATENLTVLAGWVVLIFGSVGMIVTPGGIGAYPALIGSILVAYGLTLPEGNAYGWVSWMAQAGITVVLGLLALVILPVFNRNKQHEKAGLDKK